MHYESRWDPMYQLQEHPAVLNRDKMWGFWTLMENFDQYRLDETNLDQEMKEEKDSKKVEIPLNMTVTESP